MFSVKLNVGEKEIAVLRTAFPDGLRSSTGVNGVTGESNSQKPQLRLPALPKLCPYGVETNPVVVPVA